MNLLYWIFNCFFTLWAYRPSFRILLTNDYLRTIGVLFVMFLFIFIVCLITALIINYTRCQTIVLNNRYLFDNLKKLGASPHFLSKEIKKQCSHVFKVPASVGMASMYLLFTLILGAQRVGEDESSLLDFQLLFHSIHRNAVYGIMD